MELFITLLAVLMFRMSWADLKNRVFLELKNYSYTFEDNRFQIEVVPRDDNSRVYELFEDEKGLYILVPVPVTQKDLLKIIYPRELLLSDRNNILIKITALWAVSSTIAIVLSLLFSLYALKPLREALNMIEEVTKDIIHDLNTPLMSLKVNLKILKSRYKDEEIERAELALRQIQSLRENLRPLESKAELKLEDVDLREIISSELESLKKIYPETRVREDLQEVTVKADRQAVLRVVSNLLENAFKHNLRGGWVRVELWKGGLRIENPSKPVENPNRLFDRYYKESQRGLGLGLAIVKKLCEELGWQVRAEYKGGLFIVEVTFR